jgi:hypothetical protein
MKIDGCRFSSSSSSSSLQLMCSAGRELGDEELRLMSYLQQSGKYK